MSRGEDIQYSVQQELLDQLHASIGFTNFDCANAFANHWPTTEHLASLIIEMVSSTFERKGNEVKKVIL